MAEPLLLDTAYVQALLNRNDQYHEKAKQLMPRVRAASVVLITEAVLMEIGNALSALAYRKAAAHFIDGCYSGSDKNLRVVPTDTNLIRRSLSLFDERPDKTWSLTDCTSFLTMESHGIRDAVTGDHHFVQAGYRALMLEE
jgi:predicted nucleic acid-binding protein